MSTAIEFFSLAAITNPHLWPHFINSRNLFSYYGDAFRSPFALASQSKDGTKVRSAIKPSKRLMSLLLLRIRFALYRAVTSEQADRFAQMTFLRQLGDLDLIAGGKINRMAEVVSPLRSAEAADLLDCLPLMEDDFLWVNEDALRGLFDAMRLELHYNKLTDKVRIRVTVDAQTVDSLSRAVTLAGRQAGNGQGKNMPPDVTLVRRRAPNGNRTKVTKEFLRTPVQVSATYRLG